MSACTRLGYSKRSFSLAQGSLWSPSRSCSSLLSFRPGFLVCFLLSFGSFRFVLRWVQLVLLASGLSALRFFWFFRFVLRWVQIVFLASGVVFFEVLWFFPSFAFGSSSLFVSVMVCSRITAVSCFVGFRLGSYSCSLPGFSLLSFAVPSFLLPRRLRHFSEVSPSLYSFCAFHFFLWYTFFHTEAGGSVADFRDYFF